MNDPAIARALLAADGERGDVVKGRGTAALRPLIGNGVFFAEGADWRAKRVAALSVLQKDELAGHTALVQRHLEQMLVRWRRAPGGRIDLYAELRRMCVELFGEMLLGTTAFRSPANRALIDDAWSEAIRRVFSVTGMFPSSSGARAIARLRSFVGALAADARRDDVDAVSALAKLARVQRDDAAGGGAVHSLSTLTDEGVTFAIAGQECAALAIAWTLALLGHHAPERARVVAEVDDALGARVPAPHDAARLPRTRAAFHEALRLYPPAWLIARETRRAFDFGSVQLPAHATVLISLYLLQRSPLAFDEPLAFRPARFEGAGLDARGREAFMPFSAGPRACIGVGLATMLALIVVPRVLQRFSLAVEALPDVAGTLTLHPRAPLWATIAPRPPQHAGLADDGAPAPV